MAALVLRQGRQRQRRIIRRAAASAHPRMYLADDTGLKLELPYAPRTVELGGVTPSWQTVNRAGRLPLLLNEARQLHSLSFDVIVVADPTDHQRSAEELLYRLRVLANRGGRVTLGNMGPSERVGNGWRLVDLSQRSVLRAHGTNHITRAEVGLTFLEASDAVVNVGPITGGAKPPPAVPPKPAAAGKPPAARTHTVKAGDTLWAIAVRYYGNGQKWRGIADANGVRDPRKLRIGTVLKIA